MQSPSATPSGQTKASNSAEWILATRRSSGLRGFIGQSSSVRSSIRGDGRLDFVLAPFLGTVQHIAGKRNADCGDKHGQTRQRIDIGRHAKLDLAPDEN